MGRASASVVHGAKIKPHGGDLGTKVTLTMRNRDRKVIYGYAGVNRKFLHLKGVETQEFTAA
jgi:hypothetical protein